MSIEPICSHPSAAELSGRLTRVQAAMARQGLDYYLCPDPANIFHLTNFANYVHERPFILLLPAVGSRIFLVPKLEHSHVLCRVACELELVEYFEFPAPPGEMWHERLLDVLRPGMVFSIEPGIYLPGVGGFRFSDTVLITATGNRKLTLGPESLQELTLKQG